MAFLTQAQDGTCCRDSLNQRSGSRVEGSVSMITDLLSSIWIENTDQLTGKICDSQNVRIDPGSFFKELFFNLVKLCLIKYQSYSRMY